MLRPNLKNYFRKQGFQIKKRVPGKENSLEIEIAEMIGYLRFVNYWTQTELAREMGTTQSVIARLESGWDTPSLALLKRVGEAFGLVVRVHFYEPHEFEEVFDFEDESEANTFNF